VMFCLMNCELVFLESWYVYWIVILYFLNYDPVQALNNVERFYCKFFFQMVYSTLRPKCHFKKNWFFYFLF
jgi:hypothetical protein